VKKAKQNYSRLLLLFLYSWIFDFKFYTKSSTSIFRSQLLAFQPYDCCHSAFFICFLCFYLRAVKGVGGRSFWEWIKKFFS
jgi:hypothetical protein